MNVLLKPLITEKLNLLQERGKDKQYAFEVDLDANKIQVKQAIEARYGVTVTSVRTQIKPARRKARFTKTGLLEGKTSRTKKAVVTLATGQEIDFYGNL